MLLHSAFCILTLLLSFPLFPRSLFLASTMLVSRVLTTLLVPIHAVLLAAAANSPSEMSWKHRLQARRANIVKQLQEGSHRLRARASPLPCETSAYDFPTFCRFQYAALTLDFRPLLSKFTATDTDGNCCTTTALDADFKCCPADQVYTPECGDPSCCDDGVLYGPVTDGGCCRL